MCPLPAFMMAPRDRFVGYDADAKNYILAVEQADGQRLETGVLAAINNFVVGCKTDGLWTALESCLLLAGPRTLNGILVPLRGPAPTNQNFVSGDYVRKTGLIGNGSTKQIDSNYLHTAAPQNDRHLSVYVSQRVTGNANEQFVGQGWAVTGSSGIRVRNDSNADTRLTNVAATVDSGGGSRYTGFHGMTRSSSGSYTRRTNSSSASISRTSQTPRAGDIWIFSGDSSTYTTVRLSFYSAGLSLSLDNLQSCVDTYMSTLNSVLP